LKYENGIRVGLAERGLAREAAQSFSSGLRELGAEEINSLASSSAHYLSISLYLLRQAPPNPSLSRSGCRSPFLSLDP
jgi:hypothetical protein